MATLARAYPHTSYDASIIRSCCDTYYRIFHRFYKSACQIWKRVGRVGILYGKVVAKMSNQRCCDVMTLVRYVVNWDQGRAFRFAWRASLTRCVAGSRVWHWLWTGNYRNGIYNSAGESLTFPGGSLRFPRLPPENKPGGLNAGRRGGVWDNAIKEKLREYMKMRA